MSNKRKATRQKCYVPVEAKAGTPFAKAKTLDISQGGIGFLGRTLIPLRKQVAVEIQVTSESDPVLAIGRVCWVKQQLDSKFYRFGLKFSKLLSGSLQELK